MFPMERLSVMGFVEPARRLPELLKIRGAVYAHFLANPPDVFLGIEDEVVAYITEFIKAN